MPTLSRFKDIHQGQRCVIVCNGPSLNDMDLAFLRRETVIGLNKIHLGLDRFGFYPRYLVAVNAKVVEQSRAELAAMSCIKFIGRRAAAFLPEDAFTYHMQVLGPPVIFSKDITEGVREGGTVTHAALQVAYYMGFSEVVIIGMDHRYSFSGAPHENKHLEGPDPNHFSTDYFAGKTWNNPDLVQSEQSYAEARRIFEADGRRILDATLNGACTVFDKIDYRTLAGSNGG
ncbi:DUF115 domain-containing protein [Rhizobium sp. TRM95111]|uniref:6-hydroxymethylpterin diphosphokinase MptE-like protein n=1 Tax=Rhizobium alarense TaxID=2846851 RepID=UPI001F2754A3|nr:6-hydroxymethylpterin diphosphokinase MptE-like protein [Rhizobium alarense]MCF3639069.1 DUF115 domain-containing protein [Rhizobium alarense]